MIVIRDLLSSGKVRYCILYISVGRICWSDNSYYYGFPQSTARKRYKIKRHSHVTIE